MNAILAGLFISIYLLFIRELYIAAQAYTR